MESRVSEENLVLARVWSRNPPLPCKTARP
jgi:hypothetical protein